MLDTKEKPREPMNAPFTDELDAREVPCDASISMMSELIDEHGQQPVAAIPAIAKRWGARYVHIVAHTKRGPDSGAFLAGDLPPNLGVHSLTTLSTPHHSPAGPDFQLDGAKASTIESNESIWAGMGWAAGWNAGTKFPRTSHGEGVLHPVSLPKLPAKLTVDVEEAPVVYQAISADANLNGNTSTFGNSLISHDDTCGIPGQGRTPDLAWAYALEQVYRLLGTVASTALVEKEVIQRDPVIGAEFVVKLLVVKETRNPEFLPNDFAVTLRSAHMAPRFEQIATLSANQSTVALG